MRNILKLYQILLNYPDNNFHSYLDELMQLLESYENKELNKLIKDIKKSFSQFPSTTKIEEIYSQAFDWNPATCLYAGFYLFGESYFRSTFLVKLKDIFKEHDYQAPENDLPDHFSILIDFCITKLDDIELNKFMESVVLEALDKFLNTQNLTKTIIDKSFARGKAYYYLLLSLHQFLSNYMAEQIILTTT